tara:strand:- start:643 stop:930 length:288 start_codon:yes stop_codon:yes gene_type:complete
MSINKRLIKNAYKNFYGYKRDALQDRVELKDWIDSHTVTQKLHLIVDSCDCDGTWLERKFNINPTVTAYEYVMDALQHDSEGRYVVNINEEAIQC